MAKKRATRPKSAARRPKAAKARSKTSKRTAQVSRAARTAEAPPVKRTELLGGRMFDAAPDPIDLRDLVYRPRLRSLPSQYPAPSVIKTYLPKYKPAVDDQGTEGACTGFG